MYRPPARFANPDAATTARYLIEQELPQKVISLGTIKTIIAPCAYALSIAVSFFPKLCIIFFVAMPAFYILPSRLDRHRVMDSSVWVSIKT